MNAVSAVFFFAVLRASLAGYGGMWFLPVVAGEAVNASLAFLCIAVGHWALRSLAKSDHDPAERVMHVATFAILFAAFGKGWIEPHIRLSSAFDVDSHLNPPLILIGALVGMASERLTRSLGVSARAGTLWATAGWLMVGPLLYANFDHIVAGRRLASAATIAATFAGLALVITALGRVFGAVRLRNFLMAVAAGALAFVAVGPSSVGDHARADADSVVVVVVDTLRADMLDTPAGSTAHPMPRLAEIARRGIRFTNAVAPSPWTLPSTATILSGMNPYRHRVGAIAGTMALRGRPDAFQLAPTLRAAGFQSASFVNNPYLRPYYGFDAGTLLFRRYHGTAHDGTALAMSWMSRHDYRPFFTLLHLMDPHWPYEAPAGFDDERGECSACDDLSRLQYEVVDAEVRAEVERRYRAEVAFTDHEIGRFYDELDKHHLLERTWIIVTSDHGEEFWDRGGFLHGHSLYDELLRVPLVLIPPRGSRMPSVRVVDHQVRLEDIAPTVLEIALGEGVSDQKRVLADGSPATLRFDGRSLLEFVVGENEEAVDSEPRTALLGFVQAESSLRYGVRGRHYKLIDQGEGKFRLLYDLLRDPEETRNLAAQNPDTVRLLMKAPREMGLDPLQNPSRIDTAGPVQTLDADLADELRSLGYLD
jgi:arylsulfatase A-like enzyme